jgi:hypothetical protein
MSLTQPSSPACVSLLVSGTTGLTFFDDEATTDTSPYDLEKVGQSTWAKNLQDGLNLGTIDVSARLIVLGTHGAKAQAHSAEEQ